MNLRLLVILLAVVSACVAAGFLTYDVWYNQFNPVPTDEQAQSAFDRQLQNMSGGQERFEYSLVSFRHITDSPVTSHVWCVVIQPPLDLRYTPSHREASVDHFLIYQRFDGEWTGFLFDDPIRYGDLWAGDGCGAW